MGVKAPSGPGDPISGSRSELYSRALEARLHAGKGQAIPETSIGLNNQAGRERPEDGWTRQARVELQVGGQWASGGGGQDWTKSVGAAKSKPAGGQGTVSIDGPSRQVGSREQSEALGKVKENGLSGWEKSAWAHRAVAAFEESMRFVGGMFTRPFAT